MARLLALLAVLAAAWAWAYAAAPPCNEITKMIMPCVDCLTGQASAPYAQCCAGVTALNGTVSSRDDRMAICNCLKSMAANFPGIDYSRAAKLPGLCGVSVKVGPNIDCNSLPQQRELGEAEH